MPKNKRYTMKTSEKGKDKPHGYIELKGSAESADLYIYGDICDDELTAYWHGGSCPQDIADFIAELDQNEQVNVYINSPGGDVFAGLAICNILSRHKGKKIAQVDGMAASMASVIFAACDERQINTGAQLMIHNPWTYTCGDAGQLRETADLLDEAKESCLEFYMKAVKEGVTKDQLSDLMDAETWMRGEKAAEYFDVKTNEGAAAAAMVKSDLFGRYKNLPEDLKHPEEKEDSRRADALLADLYLYGTR